MFIITNLAYLGVWGYRAALWTQAAALAKLATDVLYMEVIVPNYYKRYVPVVPAWAAALGVRSPAEMQFIEQDENGEYVFRPPGKNVLEQIVAEAARRKQQGEKPVCEAAVEEQTVEKPPAENKQDDVIAMPILTIDDNLPVPMPPRPSTTRRQRRHQQGKQRRGRRQPSANKMPPLNTVHPPSQPHHLNIDLNAVPSWLYNMTLQNHIPGGLFQWDEKMIYLFRSPVQQNGQSVYGGTYHQNYLSIRRPFNMNLMMWLMKHQAHIPQSWFGMHGAKFFFWGTVLRDGYGRHSVMYMEFVAGRWRTNYKNHNDLFGPNDYVVCRY